MTDHPHSLQRLITSRAALLQAIGRIDEDRIIQIPVEGSWTGRDLLAHITSWERACLVPLRDYATGGAYISEDIPDHEAWNAKQAMVWQGHSLQQILDEFTSVRQELVDLVKVLPLERWHQQVYLPWGETGDMNVMLNGLAWHEEEHLKSIVENLY